MQNIHLVNDEKFINTFINRFHKFHKEKTYYFIDVLNDTSLKHIEIHNKDLLKCKSFSDINIIDDIEKCIDPDSRINLFIHFLDYKKARIVKELQKKFTIKTYWIFYGADLYNRLYKYGNYELYDRNNNLPFIEKFLKRILRNIFYGIKDFKEEYLIKKIIEQLDYFCFWNQYDFKLLNNHYNTTAKFKPFIYDSFNISNIKYFKESNSKFAALVNHSASLSGNHITILSKFIELEMNRSIQIVIPLNYGDKQVMYKVDSFAHKKFKDQYIQMLEFLDNKEYYRMLKNIDFAFFGHRRQEAGGNIIFLLASGAKIFLREDNSLLKFFKELGLKIYSFEKDFNNKLDLIPLTSVEKSKNREIILYNFSDKAVDEMFKNIY